MTTLKVGDRVKVAAFEATVRQIGAETGLPYVQRDGEDSYVRIYPDLAELIAPPLKAGDVIEGEAAYESLPIGAVVADGYKVLVRVNGGICNSQSGTTENSDQYFEPRTLVYLPE